MPTLRTLPLALAATAALVAAGCGSSDDKTTSSAASSAPSATSTGSSSAEGGGERETVTTTHGRLGTFLADEEGKTLYLFEKDKSPTSTCSGQCAAAWPPVTTSAPPRAEGGAKASLLSTSKRSDGTTQVVYDGHPLYYYAGDRKAGDTTGQGLDQFGAEWYVLGAAGHKLETGEDHGDDDAGGRDSSSDDSSGGSSSGGGYSSAY
jgi:predicted lipoprotein with Yx(FWY)xxD motif